MTNPSANLPALPPGESWLPGPKPPDEDWSRKKFYFILAFVLAAHLALIFLFESKKAVVTRTVANVPYLRLSDNTDEFTALANPTLFALPNQHDLVSAFWRHVPAVKQPNFNWTEAPRYLQPAPGNFGAAFEDYLRQSQPAEFPLNFKPGPKLILPEVAFGDGLPDVTTMQISGELAQRRRLNTVDLPSLPRNEVIGPSLVQLLVDASGNVYSAVALKSNSGNEPDHDADQTALQLARKLRFAPAPHLTLGEITFTWHTVPLTNTNVEH